MNVLETEYESIKAYDKNSRKGWSTWSKIKNPVREYGEGYKDKSRKEGAAQLSCVMCKTTETLYEQNYKKLKIYKKSIFLHWFTALDSHL